MTTRITAAMAAGSLAVGILVGAAGMVVIGAATADGALDRHHEQMGSTMGSMAGMGGMMEMMGGSMMGEPGSMGLGSPQHEAHHPDADE